MSQRGKRTAFDLTPAERTTIALFDKGHTASQIAKMLDCGPVCIHVQITHALEKRRLLVLEEREKLHGKEISLKRAHGYATMKR